MIISKDIGKACDKIQHSFMIKTLNKLETEGSFLNLIKGICNKTVNIILSRERLNTFLLRSETRQECVLSLLFNIVLKILTSKRKERWEGGKEG